MSNQEVVGIVFAGKPLTDIWNLRSNIIIKIFAFSIFIFIIAALFSYKWFERKIVIPVINIYNSLLRLLKNKNIAVDNFLSNSSYELAFIDNSIDKMVDLIVDYEKKLE